MRIFSSVNHHLRAILLCTGCAIGLSLFTQSFPTIVEAGSRKSTMQAQGSALFADKGCAHCHGASGFGGSDTGPDLSNVRKELKPAEIAQQIHDGGNNMPPFGDALSGDEVASLVEYLRSKRKPPPGYHPHAAPAPVAVTPAAHPDPD